MKTTGGIKFDAGQRSWIWRFHCFRQTPQASAIPLGKMNGMKSAFNHVTLFTNAMGIDFVP
ncbi:hypothetical protein OUZ56_009270 [Daphnia magna]|uniref:Uncharacterized protein n=1 Tax=Daphnia magna TaxID=35525 RepID=A0ABR0AFJ8_9CRUS|nr:hypothetical protein OUZ56_009270 [Daphnia magna]